MPAAVHLTRGADRAAAVAALATATGGRVGLAGVLADLDRTAVPTRAPGAAYAVAWDEADQRDARWWPQGVTSSADASPAETYAGRRVLLTTAYAKKVGDVSQGARITVVDVSDETRVRYRHVLLVRAVGADDGGIDLQPVRIHAGGAVWRGRHLHVAGTTRGVVTFDLDDIVAVDEGSPGLLGRTRTGTLAAYGHRYVLPVRRAYLAGAEETTPLRYSFLGLTHPGRAEVVVGEYGRGGLTTRLGGFALDDEGLPVAGADGMVRPRFLGVRGPHRMQGAVRAQGRLYVVTSAGPRRRGTLWTGTSLLAPHEHALPVGPEDLTYWPSTDRLWTVTEYPGARFLVALPRPHFS